MIVSITLELGKPFRLHEVLESIAPYEEDREFHGKAFTVTPFIDIDADTVSLIINQIGIKKD